MTIAHRVDGPDKVTGRARYLRDLPGHDAAEGVLVCWPGRPGRIIDVDTRAALAVPGVLQVFAGGAFGALGPLEHWAAGQRYLPLVASRVRYSGEPVALVVAETASAAARGARAVVVQVDEEDVGDVFGARLDEGIEIKDWAPTRTSTGSVDEALRVADLTVSGRYRTVDRHHAAMEPSAALARWTGDHLDLVTSTQWVYGVRAAMAEAFAIPAEQVAVRTEFVGGGFGGKGSAWPHEFLAVAAARLLDRPVRIVVHRDQSFALHGHQPATVQDVTLGARRDGTLVAVRHHSTSAAARDEDYVEHGSLGTRSLYACENIETVDRIVRLARPQPTFMRAPHEGPGVPALEIAMDELAHGLGLDPLELRIRNHSTHDPTSGKVFSSKALLDCYRIGAERFDWKRRRAEPGGREAGGVRVGVGMASALMSTFRFGAAARVTIERDGAVLVETAAHEIGTGVATVLTRIVADGLGVDPGAVTVSLGSTDLPEAGGTFGSATTLSVGSAVQAAAGKLRAALEDLAGEPGLLAREYPEVMALRRVERLSETGTWAPRREDSAWAMNAYGAVFAEVRIDPVAPVPRVSRLLGVYSCGRIMDPRGARSQAVGGLIWGLGQALLEEAAVDRRTGGFVPAGFGAYQIPGCADAPQVEAYFVEEHDPHASAVGARGVGEIGTIGVGAAVTNAVFHATGVRVRDLPIRVEALLDAPGLR